MADNFRLKNLCLSWIKQNTILSPTDNRVLKMWKLHQVFKHIQAIQGEKIDDLQYSIARTFEPKPTKSHEGGWKTRLGLLLCRSRLAIVIPQLWKPLTLKCWQTQRSHWEQTMDSFVPSDLNPLVAVAVTGDAHLYHLSNLLDCICERAGRPWLMAKFGFELIILGTVLENTTATESCHGTKMVGEKVQILHEFILL